MLCIHVVHNYIYFECVYVCVYFYVFADYGFESHGIVTEGVAVNHLKILSGHSKYELNEVVEGECEGSFIWETICCCMVLLLAALAIVDTF